MEKKPQVAAFPFPFGSHPTALLHLVQRLTAAVRTVQFSFFNTTASNQKLFSTMKLNGLDNILSYDIDDGVPEGHVFSGNPMEAIELFIKATPANFRKRLDEVVEAIGLNVTCLLTDAFLGFLVDMAAELGIPWVAFWTSDPTPLSLHIYSDQIHRNLGKIGRGENSKQTLDFLPGMSAIRASDLPDELLNSAKPDKPFSSLVRNMGLVVPRASSVVLNSFDGIDPVVVDDLKSKLQKVLSIGPFPPPPCEDETGCLSWLSRHNAASVAYISFGSMLTPPPHELAALAEALEEKKVSYLWSFRENVKGHLLEGFFERTSSKGKVVAWAPQSQILAHSSVGVFLTHCGWNSMMESISGGVPMICRPFVGDQMINRRILAEVWRIGVGLEGDVFTKDGTKNAFDMVFSKENGDKIRENVCVLKENATKAVAADGSSSESFEFLIAIVINSFS